MKHFLFILNIYDIIHKSKLFENVLLIVKLLQIKDLHV